MGCVLKNKSILFSFFIGILYGLFHNLTRGVIPHYFTELLSTIGMWTLVVQFAATKLSDKKDTVINSIFAMAGILAGYYCSFTKYSFGWYLELYDCFWIVIALVFAGFFGWFISALAHKRILNYDLKNLQPMIVPTVLVSESLFLMLDKFYRFIWREKLEAPIALALGILLFFISYRKQLNKIYLYACFLILVIIETLGITFTYQLLHSIQSIAQAHLSI